MDFKEFFKDKFNIALVIIQCVALILFAMNGIASIFLILALLLESAFFIVLGVKCIFLNKKIKGQESILKNISMFESSMEKTEKKDKNKIRSNKFNAILYIMLGIILFCGIIFNFAF